GGSGDDTLNGGTGGDRLVGGDGADKLNGGSQQGIFVFNLAEDSTSTAHDVVKAADFALDLWDVPGTVLGINTTIHHRKLTPGSFDANLHAVVTAGKLGSHHAVVFPPDNGNLKHHTFLIVDLNGVAGYQAHGDLVVELTGAKHLDNLDAGDFI